MLGTGQVSLHMLIAQVLLMEKSNIKTGSKFSLNSKETISSIPPIKMYIYDNLQFLYIIIF